MRIRDDNKRRLIGVVGRAGAGKDSIGSVLAKRGWVPLSFAKPIKDICRQIFAFSEEQLYGSLEEKLRPDLRYPRDDGSHLTGREAMQVVGTEIGRRLYPKVWTDLGIRTANDLRHKGKNVVITDVRFVNEGRIIIGNGGELWRVKRPSADAEVATHASEIEMDSTRMWDLVEHTIYNHGTLEDLRDEVYRLL